MPAESPLTVGQADAGRSGIAPALAAVSVADHMEVEPLLRRAAADLSALRLRLAAATRRAHSAEAVAGAARPSNGMTVDEEAAELDRRLQQERADHRRRLEDELDQARAEAAVQVATARAEAAVVVAAASGELAAASAGGVHPPQVAAPGIAPALGIAPPAGTVPVPVVAPTSPEPPWAGERSRPSLVERAFRRDLGLSIIEVAIVLLLVALLVAVVR